MRTCHNLWGLIFCTLYVPYKYFYSTQLSSRIQNVSNAPPLSVSNSVYRTWHSSDCSKRANSY